MMLATTVPGTEHYREIARTLRQAASCCLPMLEGKFCISRHALRPEPTIWIGARIDDRDALGLTAELLG